MDKFYHKVRSRLPERRLNVNFDPVKGKLQASHNFYDFISSVPADTCNNENWVFNEFDDYLCLDEER